jgi:CBS domain-containing protein
LTAGQGRTEEGRVVYKFLEQTVDGHMTRDVRTVKRDFDMLALSEMFERDDFNSYPVEDDGQIVGIVTKFDILKCFAFTPSQMLPRYQDLMARKVGDVMTPDFIYVSPDTRLTRVLQIMVEHRIRSIIVLDAAQKLVGIIARANVIAALKATAGT